MYLVKDIFNEKFQKKKKEKLRNKVEALCNSTLDCRCYDKTVGKDKVSKFQGLDGSIKLYLNICLLLTLLIVDALYICCINQLEVIGRQL